MAKVSGGQSRSGQYAIEKRAVSKEASQTAVGWGCSLMLVALALCGVIGGAAAFIVGFIPVFLAGLMIIIVVQFSIVGRWKRDWAANNANPFNETAASQQPEPADPLLTDTSTSSTPSSEYYRGVKYMTASDASVAADTPNGLKVFRNIQEFRQWVDTQQV